MYYKRNDIPSSARTAITRHRPSALARCVGGLLQTTDRVFDWGCGKGCDLIYYLSKVDIVCGWDPHYNPTPHPIELSKTFNIITCSCVLNVLEAQDRGKCLENIYAFLPAAGVAYFSVRTKQDIDSNKKETWSQKSDGWITSIGTFQHGFTVSEMESLAGNHFDNIKVLQNSPLIVKCHKI